jgi:putative membrane protein
VLISLTFQWAKSEERVSRRKDRTADRDGDKELNAYNDYLAGLQRRSGAQG